MSQDINSVIAEAPKKSKKSKLPYTMNTQVSAVFLKFYAEQCGYTPPVNAPMVSAGSPDRQVQIDYMRTVLNNIITDVNFPFDAFAIIHDSDTYCDKSDIGDNDIDIFCCPAIEKPHAHLVLIARGSQSNGQGRKRPRRVTIGSILDTLFTYGLMYRIHSTNADIAKSDMGMLKNQGLIILNRQQKQDIRTIVYLTHETDDAYSTDGKYQYDRNLVFTNNKQYFDDAHKYYADILSKLKNKSSDILELQQKFKQEGENLRDFQILWNELAPALQTYANRKLFEMHYKDGLEQGIGNIAPFTKCCIFLHGPHNVGKTYNTLEAFRHMGISVYEAPGESTGTYDDLQLTHMAFVANDSTALKDIFNLTDFKVCRLHRRNRNNSVFLGVYVVITSNLTLDEWCQKNYSKLSKAQIDAIKSRLIDVEVNSKNDIHIHFDDLRGDIDSIREIAKLFKPFITEFKKSIQNYVPVKQSNTSMQNIISNILPPDILADVTF